MQEDKKYKVSLVQIWVWDHPEQHDTLFQEECGEKQWKHLLPNLLI